MSDFRIDSQTGALIFKKSAGRQKAQQMERTVKDLSEKATKLESKYNKLLNLLLEKKLLTQEEIEVISDEI